MILGIWFSIQFYALYYKRLNLDPFRLNSYRFLVQFLLFESPFKLSSFPLDSSPRAPLPDFTFGKFINGHSAISNGPSYMAHMIWGHMLWVIWYGIGFRAKNRRWRLWKDCYRIWSSQIFDKCANCAAPV